MPIHNSMEYINIFRLAATNLQGEEKTKNMPFKISIVLMFISIMLLVSCAGTNIESNTSSSASKKLIKGTNQKYGIWIHKNKWRKQKFVNDPSLDLQMVYRSNPSRVGLLACFMDAEYGLDNAKALTVTKIRKKMPDLKIESEEKKWVNNNEILYLKLIGTINYIPATFAVYLYSEKMGTVQIGVIAPNYLFEIYEFDLFDALDGFVVLNSSNGSELLNSPRAENNIEIKIEKLNNLLQKGLINQEDYDRKKAQLLNQF